MRVHRFSQAVLYDLTWLINTYADAEKSSSDETDDDVLPIFTAAVIGENPHLLGFTFDSLLKQDDGA